MFKLGFSIYVSHFEKQKESLLKLKDKNIPIFTSLHIEEEVDDLYLEKVTSMCQWLKKNGFYLIADVSPKSLDFLSMNNLKELVYQLGLDNIRLDYGFDNGEIAQLEDIDVTYNASTVTNVESSSSEALYMHNFYPRPETGLSDRQLKSLNQTINRIKGKKAAFISGDHILRGPIFEGLPTLEKHRTSAPYVQFVDLIKNFDVDIVFVGDLMLSDSQLDLILSYIEDGVVKIPVEWYDDKGDNGSLTNQVFTVRVDSPDQLLRVKESREYASARESIEPFRTTERVRGSITRDNKKYSRYSGEIQILKTNLPSDERVNVIGYIPNQYHLILELLNNGDQFIFQDVSSV